ncbi:MAG: hypothetical protein HQK66_11675 [Desulfamplus sp.]|nr:hypothetical protein [Desulfamplus sp.]
MKQKFTFEIDKDRDTLILHEAGEMDTGSFANTHRESYSLDEMRQACLAGQAAFIEKMRRRNLFPPNDLSVKLFEAAEKMLQDDDTVKFIVEYDDVEALPTLEDGRTSYERVDEDNDDDDDVEIGDILKDDSDDLSEDDIKEIDSDDDTPRFMTDDDSELEN